MIAAFPAGRAANASAHERQQNPFVALGAAGRVALIAFILLYRILTPALHEIVYPSSTPLVAARLLADLLHTVLLLAPLILYQRSWGWLHPLIFPLAWTVATTVGKNPDSLLTPLSIFSGPREVILMNSAMQGWPELAVARAELQVTLLEILAISVYYIGFFLGPRMRVPRITFRPARDTTAKMLAVVLVAAVTSAVFIEARGGIVRHMLSLGLGRQYTLAGTGPIIVLIGTGAVAMLLWYALAPRAAAHPLFWPCLAFVLISGFITSGSRSSIAFTAIYFLMVWMLKHRKVPAIRSMVAALGFFMVLGALGELRTSSRRGDTLDFSAITSLDPARLAELSREAVGSRASGPVAVVARAPEVGYLWGKTYLAAVFFWVPSAIWEGKPRGAGGYAGDLLFQNGGGGVPVGAVGEAFWNFHVPGLVLIFLGYGVFHRWLARALRVYGNEPAVWPLYVLALTALTPNTIEFIRGVQMLVPALVFLVWLGVLRPRRRAPWRLAGQPAV